MPSSTHSNACDLERKSTPRAKLAVYSDDPDSNGGLLSFAFTLQPQPVAILRLTLPRELMRLIRRTAKRFDVTPEAYVRHVLASHFRRPDLTEFPKNWTRCPERRPA